MGLSSPKQFIAIGSCNERIIDITVSKFENHPLIDEIVLVLPEADITKEIPYFKKQYSKIRRIVKGGNERIKSVGNGLLAVSEEINTVLIHDAVRPFVRNIDIEAVISMLDKCDGCTLAVPAKDTIKVVKNNELVASTLDRSQLWHTLTPQCFKRNILESLISKAIAEKRYGTDECMIAEQMGYDIRVVVGDYFNLKITTPEDILLADAIRRSGR